MSAEKQQLTLSDSQGSLELNYYPYGSILLDEVFVREYDSVIQLTKATDYASALEVIIHRDVKKSCLLKGIHGSGHLEKAQYFGDSQSVKLEGNNLVLSLGVHFFSLNLTDFSLNWNLEPDTAEVFEFYDLQGDYLLRGEVEIHRIDTNGNIKWRFSGTNIWVNMEGKPEVTIKENYIRLLDFNSDEYLIDFDGKSMTT